MPTDSPKRIYGFGPFQIDLDRYLLMRDGKLVPLSPKVFETLIFLIENRGSVVKKDDIMSRVWPDTYVEESNLAQNIFRTPLHRYDSRCRLSFRGARRRIVYDSVKKYSFPGGRDHC